MPRTFRANFRSTILAQPALVAASCCLSRVAGLSPGQRALQLY
jgi:hypothetical protein